MKASTFIAALLIGSPWIMVSAQPADAPPTEEQTSDISAAAEEAYNRFRDGTLDLRTLAEVVPQLAVPERRPVIRETLIKNIESQKINLVFLLQHSQLAVRLGTLEILEEINDGDYGYNPWLPADSPENIDALDQWKLWAERPVKNGKNTQLYSEDQRQSYLQSIVAGDPNRSSRARRMLTAEGLSAVGFLEQFLADNPNLPAASRAHVRQAQYQITLNSSLRDQADTVARHLAFGSRDQILTAMGTIKNAGLRALPILRDFIDNPDSLIRETAIDALLLIGGKNSVEIISPILMKETDVNVIHGALRRLKDIPCQQTNELVVHFLKQDDEDLLVSTIHTATSLGGEDSVSMNFSGRRGNNSKSNKIAEQIIQTLNDPRWRVRAAALEYISKKNISTALDACIKLLEDPDEFVRYAAIKAISSMRSTKALPQLKKLYLSDNSMIGPVLQGYGALDQPLDKEMLEKLDQAPGEIKIAAIGAIGSSKSLLPVAYRFCKDDNIDVACAALRKIASDDDVVQTNNGASVLVTALRSGNTKKRTAILERLELPRSETMGPEMLKALSAAAAISEPTSLDPLYNAFSESLGGMLNAAETESIPMASNELIKELGKLITKDTQPSIRYQVAVNLARAGSPDGFQTLLDELSSYSTAQKTAICQALYEPTRVEAIELLKLLLRDPVPEVRSAAASSALSNEKGKPMIRMVLSELSAEDAILKPHEIYDYSFERILQESSNSRLIQTWALQVLNSKTASTPLKVLACIAAQNCYIGDIPETVIALTKSDDRYVRRAAWHTVTAAKSRVTEEDATTIASDTEAYVREVLPTQLTENRHQRWQHRFSDLDAEQNNRWSYNARKPHLSAAVETVIRKLATTDPSPLVRFEAGFSLLTNERTTDLDALASLTKQVPESSRASYRLTNWMENNATRATPALSPLLAAIDTKYISSDALNTLLSRIKPNKDKGFATFAALADTPASGSSDQPLLEKAEETQDSAERSQLKVVFFYKPGCNECTETRRLIETLKSDFPLIQQEEHNILEQSGILLNEALGSQFAVPSKNRSVAPAVFTQAGALVREQITPVELARLLAETMQLTEDPDWARISDEAIQVAETEVTKRYQDFTLPVVIGAGLLDGINPCAFATIIFFLSYLQVARRSSREILAIGAAFISAVFLAYLSVGLIFHSALATFTEMFAGIQLWMNWFFGVLALIAALLSFRDAYIARKGKLEDMTLQLPGFIKQRVRGVVRTGAKARNFVIAAFVSGILISLLELACTGQVYAPIIYQIQRGEMDAIFLLVLYNVAFITPLVAIFLLAWGGMTADRLIAFQQKHTAVVKIGLGIVFLVLAGSILLGHWLSTL